MQKVTNAMHCCGLEQCLCAFFYVNLLECYSVSVSGPLKHKKPLCNVCRGHRGPACGAEEGSVALFISNQMTSFTEHRNAVSPHEQPWLPFLLTVDIIDRQSGTEGHTHTKPLVNTFFPASYL